jgi:uncharacterized membrane protein
MKSKAILVFLTSILVITIVMSFVSAGSLDVTIGTTVNGVDVTEPGIPHISNGAGDTIPVRVQITANQNVSDTRIKVRILGEDIEAETGKFDMISGRTYSKLLSLKMPANIDISPSDEFKLEVSVDAREGDAEATYEFTLQRESYNLEILSVDSAKSVTAGNSLNLDIVLKNRGSHKADDTFVIVSIPSLDVEKKVYFSDLTPVDNCDNCDEEDAAERMISIKIPSDAKAGVYSVEIEAYNDDSNAKVTKSVTVVGSEQRSDVLVAAPSKDVKAGETATYDLVIINSGDRIAVYDISPENAQNLIVSVDEPIITVPADSSRTVKVKAQAGNVLGTFNFAVNVNSQGELVKRVNLTANIGKTGVTNNLVILTVVLAIIFVVLLIVLIVLLTRKPEKVEEFGESYY